MAPKKQTQNKNIGYYSFAHIIFQVDFLKLVQINRHSKNNLLKWIERVGFYFVRRSQQIMESSFRVYFVAGIYFDRVGYSDLNIASAQTQTYSGNFGVFLLSSSFLLRDMTPI